MAPALLLPIALVSTSCVPRAYGERCDTDGTCPSDELVCSEGGCTLPCESSDDCPGLDYCEEGVCIGVPRR